MVKYTNVTHFVWHRLPFLQNFSGYVTLVHDTGTCFFIITTKGIIMLPLSKEVMYVDTIDLQNPFFLAADIGGTNSNFGVFALLQERPVLVLSLHYKSQQIKDFTDFMKQVVDYIFAQYAISFKSACIGVAGITYPARVMARPTNIAIEINTHDVMKATGLKDVFLINDFEAVALGVELLNEKDIITINRGVHYKHANMAFLGAGTGLGKSVMVWHRSDKRYFPVSSEGGHADAVFYDQREWDFQDFVYKHYNVCPISWEMILSGVGIQKIYHFLGTQKKYPITELTKEIELSDFNPDRISAFAKEDQRSKDTFDLYLTFYARCLKNFALDSLSMNGIYIAGGIAAKNASLFFDPQFMTEFIRCGKQSKQLVAMPVALIADYNVSLYGVVVAAQLRKEGEL